MSNLLLWEGLYNIYLHQSGNTGPNKIGVINGVSFLSIKSKYNSKTDSININQDEVNWQFSSNLLSWNFNKDHTYKGEFLFQITENQRHLSGFMIKEGIKYKITGKEYEDLTYQPIYIICKNYFQKVLKKLTRKVS